MVERPLSMREVPGSIPGISIIFIISLGKHFRHIRVVFTEKVNDQPVWEVEADVNKAYLASVRFFELFKVYTYV